MEAIFCFEDPPKLLKSDLQGIQGILLISYPLGT